MLVHAGPFGNIAHGNSSVFADPGGILLRRLLDHRGRLRGRHGRGALLQHQVPDLGPRARRRGRGDDGQGDEAALGPAPRRGRAPAAAEAMLEENPEEVQLGAANLLAHLAIVRRHGVTPVVAINAMAGDFASEHAAIRDIAAEMGARAAVCTHFADGGRGAVELAEAVSEAAEEPSGTSTSSTRTRRASGTRSPPWPPGCTAPTASASFHAGCGPAGHAMSALASATCRSASPRPTCPSPPIPRSRARPRGWRLPVREARANVGAGIVYLVSGDMRTMPGLSRQSGRRTDRHRRQRQCGRSLLM